MSDDEKYEKLLKGLGIKPSEFRLLRYFLGVPDGEFRTSVRITIDLKIPQSSISEAAAIWKDYSYIESGQKGYRRVKSVDEIKADLLQRFKGKVEGIPSNL